MSNFVNIFQVTQGDAVEAGVGKWTVAASNTGNGTEERPQKYEGDQEVDASTDPGSGSRNMIPQELTPEMITATIGGPMEKILYKNNKSTKNIKHRKRYKMHKHTHKKFKKNKKGKKYVNVDKHLIKRGNKRTKTTKRSDIHRAERSSYQAPISKQLESVLNAQATQDFSYSNKQSNAAQWKRSYPAETRRSNIDESDINYDYDYDDSSDETSGAANDYSRTKQMSTQKVRKTKRKKTDKRVTSTRKRLPKHRLATKQKKQGTGYNYLSTGNKTMTKSKAKYEAPVRKFKFFGVARNDVQTENKTVFNQGIYLHVLFILF